MRETPIRVPSVSKRSTKKNANITTKKLSESARFQPAVTAPSLAVCVQAEGSNTAPKVWPNSWKVEPSACQ